MMKFLSGTVFGALTFLGGVLIGQAFFIFPAINSATQTAPIAGAFNTTGGGTYNLQATITSSQNTIQLSSFLEPQSNIPYTMSYLNSSIEYATIAPQTSQSEFISFTGITQNNDGSATLTGVQRGLDRSYPYTASTTLALPHAGQTRLILSNPPQVYNNYAALTNNNVYEGTNTFSSTSPAFYDADPVWANFSTQTLADVAYVNSVVSAGAANASETIKGIIQLATGAQSAAGTSAGSTGARLVVPNSLASSTPYSGTPQGSFPTSATTGGKISQLWLDLTQPFTVSGLWTFVNGFISQASSTVSGNLNVGSLTIGSAPAQFSHFGGSGSDGAFSCSNGTTTIALAGAVVVIKNYTTISITGTCYVQITGGNINGSEVILKSQGNVTLTSTNVPMLDATSTGATGATAVSCTNNSNSGGSGNSANAFGYIGNSTGGGGGTNVPAGGAAGNTGSLSYPNMTNVSQTPYNTVFVGSGGGGGNCGPTNPGVSKGGSGGNGGGALIIEVGGTLNFTTTNGISVAGSVGGNASVTSGSGEVGAGGSAGGGGFFEMLYNTLTANTGSVNIAAAAGGSGAGSGNNTGSGGSGGNPIVAGTAGNTANGGGASANGVSGAAGYSLIGQNPR